MQLRLVHHSEYIYSEQRDIWQGGSGPLAALVGTPLPVAGTR